jgi:hypothetical protein
MDPRSLLSELADVLDLLELTSAEANDQITSHYFRHVVAINWAAEEGV